MLSADEKYTCVHVAYFSPPDFCVPTLLLDTSSNALYKPTLCVSISPPSGALILLLPGSQLEAGDLRGVSYTLSSSWVDDFKRATAVLDASDSESSKASAIFDGISSLQASASSGDLKGSKQKYVALVAAVSEWANSTGLATNLKGL